MDGGWCWVFSYILVSDAKQCWWVTQVNSSTTWTRTQSQLFNMSIFNRLGGLTAGVRVVPGAMSHWNKNICCVLVRAPNSSILSASHLWFLMMIKAKKLSKTYFFSIFPALSFKIGAHNHRSPELSFELVRILTPGITLKSSSSCDSMLTTLPLAWLLIKDIKQYQNCH